MFKNIYKYCKSLFYLIIHFRGDREVSPDEFSTMQDITGKIYFKNFGDAQAIDMFKAFKLLRDFRQPKQK